MIDTTKAKADAEEGLRIAEKATAGPWTYMPSDGAYGPRSVVADAHDRGVLRWFSDDTSLDGLFAADSRTRAPDAYRNVIALAEENERLRAKVARCGELELYNLRIGSRRLGDLIAMQEKVTALEAEVERLRLALQSSQDQVACYKSREPGW